MGVANKGVGRGKSGSGGRHGAANTGVGRGSVKGRSTANPAAGKVSKKNATGGGPGGGF